MRDDNKIINSLWIGTKLSSVELLTIKSFLNNGHQFRLWTYDDIETSIPEGTVLKDANEIFPRKNIFKYKYSNQFGHGKGSYAGFSDIFRYKLLYINGGWWTDMDVSCLKPLDFDEEYVFRTHHCLPLIGNIMKCPPESQLMKNCFEEAVIKVDENNKDWHLPIQILVNNIFSLGLDKYIRNFSNHDRWDVVSNLLKKELDIPENWYIIHWVNEEWRKNKISKDYFLKDSTIKKLADKNMVNTKDITPIKSLKTKIKLTKMNFGLSSKNAMSQNSYNKVKSEKHLIQ